MTEPYFPKLSVLHLEYEVPAKRMDDIYAAASETSDENDPFAQFEQALSEYIEDRVRLIGFVVIDH